MSFDPQVGNFHSPPNFSSFFVEPSNADFLPKYKVNEDPNPGIQSFNLANIILSVAICVFGIFGNLIVLFVIIVLKEYSKSVTHWYVLQLAIADLLFLLTLPFKISEDFRGGWTYSEWMCKAIETILFLNYYASCLFLMVMSIDRYIAVCKAFSEFWQKLRKRYSAFVIASTIWAIALLLCIPVMLYTFKTGVEPTCTCSYEFPSEDKKENDCFMYESDPNEYKTCIMFLKKNEKKCQSISTTSYSYFMDDQKDDDNFTDIDFYNSTSFELNEPHEEIFEDLNDPTTIDCYYGSKLGYLQVFFLFNFVVMFLIPFLIMFVCYGLIVRRLLSSTVRSNTPNPVSFTHSINNGSKQQLRKKSSSRASRDRKRVTVMCAALVSTFLFCWLPFHGIHLAKIIGIKNSEVSTCKILKVVGSLFGFLNSALNPYLYSFLGTNFSRRWRTATKSIQQTFSRRSIFSHSSAFRASQIETKLFPNVSTSGIKTIDTKLNRVDSKYCASTFEDPTQSPNATNSLAYCNDENFSLQVEIDSDSDFLKIDTENVESCPEN